jgi:hypothetical protein
MFEHVTILLSIIFTLAMTHLLATATELVWERDRVRFSGLHALWMVNAMLGLLAYWLTTSELAAIKRWTTFEVFVQFIPAIVQYFACSLLSMRHDNDRIMDMKAFYERQRPAIFSAFSLMMVTTIIGTYAERNIFAEPGAFDWMGAEIPLFLMFIATVIAGWARPAWMQWIAALFIFGLEALFVATYTVRP